MRTVPDLKITFFGDSICVGQYVSLHRGWVARVSELVSRDDTARGYRTVVTNASANGRTSRLALEAMAYEVSSHSPEVLIVQFGMNDCNYWKSDRGIPRVSQKAFVANLEEIVARGVAAGCKRILLNTNHPTGRDREVLPPTNRTYESSNREYNALIREVAQRLGGQVELIDIERAFIGASSGDRSKIDDLLLPDRLHLAEAGHDLYFSIVAPVVTRIVEELRAERDP